MLCLSLVFPGLTRAGRPYGLRPRNPRKTDSPKVQRHLFLYRRPGGWHVLCAAGQRKADEISQFQAVHPEAHFALGILYAEAGLLEQGEHELGQLPKGDPDYDLAQKLLKGIQEIRNPPR